MPGVLCVCNFLLLQKGGEWTLFGMCCTFWGCGEQMDRPPKRTPTKHNFPMGPPTTPTHATALGSPPMDLDYDLHNLAKRGESRGTHDARMLTSNENPQS